MRDSQFEWDDAKAAINLAKHGVTFEEARRVFSDQNAVEFVDNRREYDEERWIRIGMVDRQLMVVAVAFTDRGDRFRIISAMAATKAQRRRYAKGY